ncbi:MAG: DUF1559 domain-containing protein [Victivallaceae bacterium]
MKRRIFTLIELLVVIAIIAILASMLLPALNQARERGKSANCQGTLKQHGVATQQYLQDYDYFPSLNNNKGVPDRLSWKFAMAPYLGITLDPAITNGKLQTALGKGAFRCPSWINGNNVFSDVQYMITDNAAAYRGGYGYNMPSLYGLGYTSASGVVSWVKTNRIRTPSETVCTIDAACPPTKNDDTSRSANAVPYNVAASATDRAGIRHLGGLNINWVDGHVSFMMEGELTKGKVSPKGSSYSNSYYYFAAEK